MIRLADRCIVERRILSHSVYMRVYEKVRLLNKNHGEEKLTTVSA